MQWIRLLKLADLKYRARVNTKAGRTRAILIAATIVAAIVAAGARPRTRATVSWHKHGFINVMYCKDVALVCVLL